MRTFLLAAGFTVVLATPAFAVEHYYLIKDTVGNCAAVIGAKTAPGMKLISKKGYDHLEDANKALSALPKSDCKGLVQ